MERYILYAKHIDFFQYCIMPVLSKESEEEKENIGNIEANNSIKENEFPVNRMVIIKRENNVLLCDFLVLNCGYCLHISQSHFPFGTI